MALQAKDNYFDTGSAGKPPRFNKDNFSLWKTRMELFLSGSDPQIPYFLENGPHVPTQTVHPIPAAGGQPAVPERELVKPVTDWNDEDRRLVNIDTKARSLIAMSLPDDVFHSVCHLRSAKEIWDTLCVQYEGTAVLMESRKIFLVRQYESFIHQKDETLSQLHQRFNCLLIDLKTIGTTYSNSEVVTKFMEALPEHWEIYTSCLTMSKDIKTLTLSELYGILLNREQQKKLKKNLIRDSKESKSTSVALVSDSVPPVAASSSSVTITELESSDSDMSEDPEFNESLALLTKSFKKFAKKGNFHKKKHLSITDKPKSDPVDKATAICYNCQGKGHFANDCRYRKSQFAPSSAKSSSKNPKYQRLKEKYKKMKTQRKGKGLIAEDCDWDDVSSDDSSDEEDTQVALMAIIKEPMLALMAKIEEVPEEIPPQDSKASSSTTPEASTSATDSSSQVPIPLIPLESLTQLDLVTLDLYKALNGKTSAEKMNIDLRGQLKECQEKLKQLTIVEENYKDQVSVNKTLCIERELALAAKEKALAQLNAEKVTIKGWSDASEKVDEILASGRPDKSKRGLGFFRGYKKEETKSDSSMLKFGKFVSSIPLPNTSENTPSSSSSITHPEGAPKSKKKAVKDKSKTETPSKTKGPKPKNKVLGGGPSVSGTKSLSQSSAPRLKIDLKQTTKEKTPIPPMSNAKGILGAGPAHLKFKNFLDHTKRFQYRKCYHCGLNDHIASKCSVATKAEKSAKVKKIPKTEKSVKGKKVVKTVSSVKTPASCTDTSVKADTDSTSPTDNSGSIDKGIWYLDSGCSRHMTGSKSVLINYREERGPAVTFGGNGKGQTRGYGTLTNGVTTFKRVAYVEGLMHNLLSISQLCDKNHKVSFSKKKCKVKNRKKEVILNGVRHADIYIINMNTSTDNFCFVSRASTDMNWLWHKRLSHLNFKTLNQLCINDLVIGLPDYRYTKESLCAACEKGKQTRASFKSKQISSISSPLQLLHMDLFGPVNVQSIGGKKYTLVIVDEYSRYTWVFFLRAKSDAPEEIILFVRKMEKLNNLTVRSIRSDHGTEFKNSTLESFFEQKGISQNFSSVRTPQQNGVAERRNRTLIEAARSMLSEANLATQFWAEAVNTACYTQNRSLIVKRFRRTAYELFRNRKPSIKHLHIFGCVCYILNNKDSLGKFDSKSDDGIFLGYSSISKTFRVFNKRRQAIEETIHVKFDESDEIQQFQVGRWITAPEAAWRIYRFPLDNDVHRKTMLTEFFHNNATDIYAQELNLTYVQYPDHFTWKADKKLWSPRQSEISIGRIMIAHPSEGERYYLRILLSKIRFPKSYDDLKICNGVKVDTFRESALLRGYLIDDNSQQLYLQELLFSICHMSYEDFLQPSLFTHVQIIPANCRHLLKTSCWKIFSNPTGTHIETLKDVHSNRVDSKKSGAFFIEGPGGTGKTFLYRALPAKIRSRGEIALATATTVCSSYCHNCKQSSLATLIKSSKLIIWDEAPTAKHSAIKALDDFLQDLMDSIEIFKGKVVVLGGDFRQTLSVLQKGTRSETIAACLTNSPLWGSLFQLRLEENMRVLLDPMFTEFLLRLGSGKESLEDNDLISIPSQMLVETNDNMDALNVLIEHRFPGEEVEYNSFDETLDPNDQAHYEDLLHSLNPNGMLPHKLILKHKSHVILLRNMNPTEGLCNGTRLLCKDFNKNVIRAESLYNQLPVMNTRVLWLFCFGLGGYILGGWFVFGGLRDVSLVSVTVVVRVSWPPIHESGGLIGSLSVVEGFMIGSLLPVASVAEFLV
ncbi:hypothetical protein OSB04_016894 [Centaurea solstitialis]|uniref:ATP-dependent DNA helicase n=1 Tax=Centaurea solstitialis TaxID=347529 RepID=A0AA38T3I3_9ASTR|nr:hypothetical protein OSB04_016894 [Centaurea solstitialis]